MSYEDGKIPELKRCGWVTADDPLYTHYHDTEWGREVRDDKALFSKLTLDGMQAGLSWITILRKRDTILEAFDGLDPDIIADYTDEDRERLLANPGIIRSRLKIDAAIKNAQIFKAMRDEEGIDFSDYLWSFVDGEPIVNRWEYFKEAPVKTAQSEAMSKDLKKRGFNFVGPVIVYAFMQAVGMVNDHEVSCAFYEV